MRCVVTDRKKIDYELRIFAGHTGIADLVKFLRTISTVAGRTVVVVLPLIRNLQVHFIKLAPSKVEKGC